MKKLILVVVTIFSLSSLSLSFGQEVKTYLFESELKEMAYKIENAIILPDEVKNSKLSIKQNKKVFLLNGESLILKDSSYVEYIEFSRRDVLQRTEAFFVDEEEVMFRGDYVQDREYGNKIETYTMYGDLEIASGKIFPEIIVFTITTFFILLIYSSYKEEEREKERKEIRSIIIIISLFDIFFTYLFIKETNLEIGVTGTIIGLIIGSVIYFSTRIKEPIEK